MTIKVGVYLDMIGLFVTNPDLMITELVSAA